MNIDIETADKLYQEKFESMGKYLEEDYPIEKWDVKDKYTPHRIS